MGPAGRGAAGYFAGQSSRGARLRAGGPIPTVGYKLEQMTTRVPVAQVLALVLALVVFTRRPFLAYGQHDEKILTPPTAGVDRDHIQRLLHLAMPPPGTGQINTLLRDALGKSLRTLSTRHQLDIGRSFIEAYRTWRLRPRIVDHLTLNLDATQVDAALAFYESPLAREIVVRSEVDLAPGAMERGLKRLKELRFAEIPESRQQAMLALLGEARATDRVVAQIREIYRGILTAVNEIQPESRRRPRNQLATVADQLAESDRDAIQGLLEVSTLVSYIDLFEPELASWVEQTRSEPLKTIDEALAQAILAAIREAGQAAGAALSNRFGIRQDLALTPSPTPGDPRFIAEVTQLTQVIDSAEADGVILEFREFGPRLLDLKQIYLAVDSERFHGILVMPITDQTGSMNPFGTMISALAMFRAAYVPEVVLDPSLILMFTKFHEIGALDEPGSRPDPEKNMRARALLEPFMRSISIRTWAEGTLTEEDPDPHLDLTFHGQSGIRTARLEVKSTNLHDLPGRIAKLIHENLGTTLTSSQARQLEIPQLSSRKALETLARLERIRHESVPDREPWAELARENPSSPWILQQLIQISRQEQEKVWSGLADFLRELGARAELATHPFLEETDRGLTLESSVGSVDEAARTLEALMDHPFSSRFADSLFASLGKKPSHRLRTLLTAMQILNLPQNVSLFIRLGLSLIDWAAPVSEPNPGSSVDKNAWLVREDRLLLAEAVLEHAFQLDPTKLEPILGLLGGVSRGLQKDQEFLSIWFERGRKIAPGHLGLHETMLKSLGPASGGSVEAMWTFIRANVSRAPTGSLVPLLVFDTYFEESRVKDEGRESFYSRKEVREELYQIFDKLLKTHPGENQILDRYAYAAYNASDPEKAYSIMFEQMEKAHRPLTWLWSADDFLLIRAKVESIHNRKIQSAEFEAHRLRAGEHATNACFPEKVRSATFVDLEDPIPPALAAARYQMPDGKGFSIEIHYKEGGWGIVERIRSRHTGADIKTTFSGVDASGWIREVDGNQVLEFEQGDGWKFLFRYEPGVSFPPVSQLVSAMDFPCLATKTP